MRKTSGERWTVKESVWFLVFVQFQRPIEGIDFSPELKDLFFLLGEASYKHVLVILALLTLEESAVYLNCPDTVVAVIVVEEFMSE